MAGGDVGGVGGKLDTKFGLRLRPPNVLPFLRQRQRTLYRLSFFLCRHKSPKFEVGRLLHNIMVTVKGC